MRIHEKRWQKNSRFGIQVTIGVVCGLIVLIFLIVLLTQTGKPKIQKTTGSAAFNVQVATANQIAGTEAPTEAPAQNVQEVTPQEPVQQQTYTAYFSQDELIQASVGGLSAHEAGILITNLSCDNGTASCSYAPYESYDFVDSITVSGASAGTVTISGTATSIGFDMYDGQSISYESASVPFTITKVVG